MATELTMGKNDTEYTKGARKWTAEQNKTYRLSMCGWPKTEEGYDFDKPSPKLFGVRRIFIPKIGQVQVPGDGSDDAAYLQFAPGQQVREAIGSVVVVWGTTKKGNIPVEVFEEETYEILPFIMSKDKYTTVRGIHSINHLGKCDLIVDCTDSKYQKMTFQAFTGGNLLRQAFTQPQFNQYRADIGQKITLAFKTLKEELGAELTPAQIRERLVAAGESVGESVSAEDTTSTADLASALNSASGLL